MSKKVILCIDDRGTYAEVRKLLLECEGYRVLMAGHSKAALKQFTKHSVDLVLLDCDTPGLNGPMVAARMHALRPEVPIVVISVHSVPSEGIKKVADAYIPKGEHPFVLVERIDELLMLT